MFSVRTSSSGDFWGGLVATTEVFFFFLEYKTKSRTLVMSDKILKFLMSRKLVRMIIRGKTTKQEEKTKKQEEKQREMKE